MMALLKASMSYTILSEGKLKRRFHISENFLHDSILRLINFSWWQ